MLIIIIFLIKQEKLNNTLITKIFLFNFFSHLAIIQTIFYYQDIFFYFLFLLVHFICTNFKISLVLCIKTKNLLLVI